MAKFLGCLVTVVMFPAGPRWPGPSRVQKSLGLNICLCRWNYSNILWLLSLKQQLVVNDRILDTEVIQSSAVGYHDSDQVLWQHPLPTPRLAEGEYDVRFGCPGDGCPGLLEGGEEAVSVVEDLGLFLFGQCPCVSDWRGAIVDNCTTESCGIDTAIFNLIMEGGGGGGGRRRKKRREREREREGRELKIDMTANEYAIIVNFMIKHFWNCAYASFVNVGGWPSQKPS